MRVQFSTGQLPAHLDRRARLAAWDEFLSAFYTEVHLDPLKESPFDVACLGAMVGRFRIARFAGTMSRFARTPMQVANALNDDFILAISNSTTPLFHRQARRDVILDIGSAVFCTNGEPGTVQAEQTNGWLFVGIPRSLLTPLLPGSENLIGRALSANNPGLVQLRNYLELLLRGDMPTHPRVVAHVEATLIDLLLLSFSIEHDMAPLARLGGIRAAHLRDIINEIDSNFTDADFSQAELCRKLRLSPRYVQSLLADADTTFTERLSERRLDNARRLLSAYSDGRMKMSDIAYASGFNDVSHFNRRFRALFGESPSDAAGKSPRRGKPFTS